jgi:murein DD-endopeptidase MepM/ murein hydrolase activator NlpD
MSASPSWSLGRIVRAAFTERRIYIRTESNTRYLLVRPATQVGSVIAIAAVLGWTGFASSSLVTGALDGHSAQIQLETISEAYEARLAAYQVQQTSLEEQLNQANQRRDEVTKRLSEKQARLVETANRLMAADTELVALRDGYESLIIARSAEADRAATLEAERAALNARLASAETSKSNLDGGLAALAGAIDKVIAERDRTTGEMAKLDGEVVQLNSAIGQMEDRQERLLSQLEYAARTSLTGLGTLFGNADVDLDRIMAQARRDYSGSGGPFEPVGDDTEYAAIGTEAGDSRVAALMSEFESVNLMRFAAERLPFGEPVYGGRRTSGYGTRRNPKGRGRSMHGGLDIAAPRGTAIYSTAEGVVTFAGRQGGYGIVVKIRHAFGFETVYAHLSRAKAKVGQRVGRGDRIADMGSTGRSTGSHLHYEIRIDRKPVNPIKFIEAARNVL